MRSFPLHAGLALGVIALLPSCLWSAPDVEWAGKGRFRLLVSVAPADIAPRQSDCRPASIDLDFGLVLAETGVSGLVDPASIQVIQYEAATGAPVEGPPFRLGKGPHDLPFRYDQIDPRPYWWLFSLLGDGQRGKLTWAHTQRGDAVSHYAIYFDLAVSADAVRAPARGWIGDGDGLFRARGPLPSMLHTRPDAFDWDGDGRLDLLIGNIRGYVFLYRNLGSPEEPEFQGPYFIEADGEPLKVPWYSAPRVADWNSDGLPDLIVGHDPRGQVRFYQNVGSRTEPKLTLRGQILADGEPITCPFEPVPEAPGIFGKDYTGVPEVVDWNGDGRLDLLVGGYVTGRIFYFENVGVEADGLPILTARGPLEADGEIFDVIWQASPTARDIDSDGLPELVTGSMFMSASGGEEAPAGRPGLFMLKNRGTAAAPVLSQVSFPLDGNWQETFLLNPKFVDWNADGLQDLIVGANTIAVLYLNVGTATEPLFRRQEPLTVGWVPHLVHPDWMGDWDGDGGLDVLQAHGGGSVSLKSSAAQGNPPVFEDVAELRTASGAGMCKPPDHGDPWAASIACDWDDDGDQDIIVGDVAGYVWYYRNTGTREAPVFDEGMRLQLETGAPLVAGIDPDTPITDFTVLQGNRAVPACADYDGDGLKDLVTGDAVGGVTHFQNVGTAAEPLFAPGKILAKLSGRVHVAAAEMTGDGRPDLIVAQSGGGAGEQVMIVENLSGDDGPAFRFPGRKLDLAWIPYPQPSVVDINGDGDLDVLLGSSYSVLYFADGSYIRAGTAMAQATGAEKREG